MSFKQIDPVQLAVREGLLSDGDLLRAREVHLKHGGSLARVCVDMGVLDDTLLANALARVLNLPRSDLRQIVIEPEAFRRVPPTVLEAVAAVPFRLREDGRVLHVAMADPQDEAGLLRLRDVSGTQLKVTVAGYREIEAALQERVTAFPRRDSGSQARDATRPGEVVFDLAAIAREAESMEQEQAAPARSPPPRPTPTGGATADKLLALQKTIKQSSKALRAALDLCVERDILTLEDIATAMKRGRE